MRTMSSGSNVNIIIIIIIIIIDNFYTISKQNVMFLTEMFNFWCNKNKNGMV